MHMYTYIIIIIALICQSVVLYLNYLNSKENIYIYNIVNMFKLLTNDPLVLQYHLSSWLCYMVQWSTFTFYPVTWLWFGITWWQILVNFDKWENNIIIYRHLAFSYCTILMFNDLSYAESLCCLHFFLSNIVRLPSAVGPAFTVYKIHGFPICL